jgi:Uma2 family endonuclease
MSSMIQTPVITLTEFLAMPETKPASEYINGQIIQKPIPQGQHSIIQRQLLFAIDLILNNQGIAQAFPELRFDILPALKRRGFWVQTAIANKA